jgi:hypothetical protein
MRPIPRAVAWLSLVFVVGLGAFVSGYYVGLRKGADTISAIHAQNAVSDSIGDLRSAFAALERNDLAASQAQHEASIRKALLDIGGYATVDSLPTWDCRPANRATMNDARLYLIQHPPAADDPLGPIMLRAAEHCR